MKVAIEHDGVTLRIWEEETEDGKAIRYEVNGEKETINLRDVLGTIEYAKRCISDDSLWASV